MQLGVIIDPQISKEQVVRPPTGPEVDRGDLPEGTAEGEPGEGIDWEELIADSFAKSSAKCRIEEVFLLNGDVEKLVRLRSLPLPKDAPDEKAVADTVGDLVGARDDVAFIDPQGPIEAIDPGDAPVFDKRLDEVLEPGRSIPPPEDPSQGGGAEIDSEVDILAVEVAANDLPLDGIEAVAVEGRAMESA